MVDAVNLAPTRLRCHIGDGDGLRQLRRRGPSQEHLFLCRIVWRTPATVREVAAIHQVPLVAYGVISRGTRRVDIRQSQRVAVFMAYRPDAARSTTNPEFGAA